MRISSIALLIICFGVGSAYAQQSGSPPLQFVPGDLLIGYQSPDDADAALKEMRGTGSNVTVRGAPVPGVQVSKLHDTVLSLHIDLPPDVAATTRGNPASELAILEEIGAQIKAADKRVKYVQPNWILSISPPPGPSGDGKILPQNFQSPLVPTLGTKNFVLLKDGPVPAAGDPNDERFPEQWDYLPPPVGMNVVNAWKKTHGSRDIVVAVIDTGIVADQEDIKASGNVLPGYDFVTKDKYSCPDERAPGPDATDPGDDRELCRSSEVQPNSPLDPSWHGTHVAGTIGAAGTNNKIGIASINWNVTILPIRVLSSHGGRLDDILKAMLWAAGFDIPGAPPNDHPADVINMSLGGPIADSTGKLYPCDATTLPAYIDVINLVRQKGVAIVVAAGNGEDIDGTGKVCKPGSPGCVNRPIDEKYWQPAGCPGVISVASSDMHGHAAYYTNYGAVTVMAPGGNELEGAVIEKTSDGKRELIFGSVVDAEGHVIHAQVGWGGIESTVKGTYAWDQGTSMASPHVAGAIALALSVRPELRHHPDLIEQAIRDATVPFPPGACPAGETCGPGLLDAAKLVQTQSTAQ